ncbi:MAG: hypothetical protein CMI96_04070 [Pelagibacteraceae bacterium]|mgnify:CR=1 FL=1|nr:hypothetical protein [Pelagibacteraceae bacterium]|tara:strand:+ start:31386 stop:32387 length:1002 start_codon:yes stop_codon:yes gene_type:complete
MNFLILFLLFIFYLFIFRNIAHKINLIDLPSSRKVHSIPTASIGGSIIIFSFLTYELLFINNFSLEFKTILVSALILFLVGLIDDIFSISFKVRLFIQCIVCTFVVLFSYKIYYLGYYDYIGPVYLYQYSVIFSIFCFLILINSYNFFDGIDGLAALNFILSIFFLNFYIYFVNSFYFFDIIFIDFGFLVLLFLFFNLGFLNKFKIFLGDSGSTLLGFMLAIIMIKYSQNGILKISPSIIPWIIALPVYDFLSVIIIRLKSKKNPFLPDNMHLHHLLLLKYHNAYFVLFLLSSISLFLFILGFLIDTFLSSILSIFSFIIGYFLYDHIKNKFI